MVRDVIDSHEIKYIIIIYTPFKVHVLEMWRRRQTRIWCTARRYLRNMCDSTNDILVWWPRNETGCAVCVTRRVSSRSSLASPPAARRRRRMVTVLLRYRSMQIYLARFLPAPQTQTFSRHGRILLDYRIFSSIHHSRFPAAS